MQVTVSPTPDPQVSVTFQVDELGINETETTVAGVATFSIASVTATNNSIWDATLQVGANMRAGDDSDFCSRRYDNPGRIN